MSTAIQSVVKIQKVELRYLKGVNCILKVKFGHNSPSCATIFFSTQANMAKYLETSKN